MEERDGSQNVLDTIGIIAFVKGQKVPMRTVAGRRCGAGLEGVDQQERAPGRQRRLSVRRFACRRRAIGMDKEQR